MAFSLTAALPLIVDNAPLIVSAVNRLRDSFAKSGTSIAASGAAIARAGEDPEHLKAALEALKGELLWLNERMEAAARELAEIARANQVMVGTLVLYRRWLIGVSLAAGAAVVASVAALVI